MKNTFGNSISITLFGESHGASIGAVLDGLAPGIAVRDESIQAALARRRPQGRISTARVEPDPYTIVSGVRNGVSTGAPLTILIPNTKMRSEDYSALENIPRPSHADYAASVKYHGYEDRRGGGHFSGRLTAPIVALCAILEDALRDAFGIEIGTHILRVGDVTDTPMQGTYGEIALCHGKSFPVLDDASGERMKEKMAEVAGIGDSIGGILESAIVGVPAGVGEPWFDSVESVLSHLLFSIGGIKGVEFGDGFAITQKLGSEANDPFAIVNGRVVTTKNASGGVQGGISNGMPILLRCAVKPTPSIYKEQASVDLSTLTERPLTVEGRHDPAIVHRVASVVNALLALGTADLLVQRYGTDALRVGAR